MKKLRIFFALLIFVSAWLFSGCEKIADTLNTGSILLNGELYSVTTASLVGVSLQDNGHATISLINGKLTGAVSTLNLDFAYSPSLPLEGEYSYPMDNGTRKLDSWLTSFTVVEGTASSLTTLESGIILIADNGDNNFTVEVDIVMKDGKSFKGSYTGNFTVLLK